MRILRTTLFGLTTLAVAAALSTSIAAGRQASGKTMPHQMPMGKGAMMTKDQKIASAMTAGPAAIAAKATIADWPANEGDPPVIIRQGTNGYTCFPDMAETAGVDPMCLDKSWMNWGDAYFQHKTPQITTVGIGYMLAPGGAWGSSTDPYAMAKTADNQWQLHPPHLMIVVPDVKLLEGVSTDPQNGGPYVMWAGTPYVHIMAPVMPAMTGHSAK